MAVKYCCLICGIGENYSLFDECRKDAKWTKIKLVKGVKLGKHIWVEALEVAWYGKGILQ